MSYERVLGRLMDFGLTRLEAKIYVFLAKFGPKPEKEIANGLNLSKKRLSHSMKNLQQEGFVRSQAQTFFTAIPLQDILDDIIERKVQEARRIGEENSV